MRLLYLYTLVGICCANNVQDAASLYTQAMAQLSVLPHKYSGQAPVYTHENLDQGIDVPEYNVETQNYMKFPEIVPSTVVEKALETLESAMDLGSTDAAVALADIHVFGNYSISPNYTRAADYYRRAVAESPHGHAYYMLGHIYSTGMFGEISMDKQRGQLYYEFAARNGDTNAALVLAYQRLNGVESAANCETAQFSYSRLARQALQQLQDKGEDSGQELVHHNINIADFQGGLYGKKISESQSSVVSAIDSFVQWRSTLRDENLDSPDSQILESYFDALQHYYGGYFAVQNDTAAFVDALMCVYIGQTEKANGRLVDPKSIDYQIWEKCQGLVGRMYLDGRGTVRDISRAHYYISSALEIQKNGANLLDMALLRMLDPTTDGQLSPMCKHYLQEAAKEGSAHGVFLYARHLIAPGSPFETSYADSTYDLIRAAASRGHHEATFYLADAIESGFPASKGEMFSCAELSSFYKNFVERSESIYFPHLVYAFEELKYGNYKNALLGYSMAAEQGLADSQLSAAYLLYQKPSLLPWTAKSFSKSRVQAAVRYLDLASAQGHVDATIMLGDLYSTGVDRGGTFTVDNAKAFSYYSKAASAASPHACYKLGYMYEYGLGTDDNAPDLYMAKRYYDLSIKYYSDVTAASRMAASITKQPNTYAIGFALLRLRLKVLFSKPDKRHDSESLGWLDTLKKLAKSDEVGAVTEEQTMSKAEAHALGETFPNAEDEYQIFDYIILGFTLVFVLYVGIQNLRRQLRRRPNEGANAGHANGANEGNGPWFQVDFFVAI